MRSWSLPVFWLVRVPCRHRLLDGRGAGHRVHDAGELDEEAVAHGLEEPPLMLGDLGLDHLGAERPDRGEGAGLVLPHHLRIADDIGGEDGGEAALDGGLCHSMGPQFAPAAPIRSQE